MQKTRISRLPRGENSIEKLVVGQFPVIRQVELDHRTQSSLQERFCEQRPCGNPWLSVKARSVENPRPENHSPGKMNFQKNVQFEDRVRGISVVGSLEQFGQVRINFALGIDF
jgi:hypothetical protein